MLIGSEITCVYFLDILYKVHIGVITPAAAVSPEILTTGNHADFGKSPLCSGASQFAAGYAAAQPRAAPLALCLGRTMKCKSTGILRIKCKPLCYDL